MNSATTLTGLAKPTYVATINLRMRRCYALVSKDPAVTRPRMSAMRSAAKLTDLAKPQCVTTINLNCGGAGPRARAAQPLNKHIGGGLRVKMVAREGECILRVCFLIRLRPSHTVMIATYDRPATVTN